MPGHSDCGPHPGRSPLRRARAGRANRSDHPAAPPRLAHRHQGESTTIPAWPAWDTPPSVHSTTLRRACRWARADAGHWLRRNGGRPETSFTRPHNFVSHGCRRATKTQGRTAVSPPSLTRMWSDRWATFGACPLPWNATAKSTLLRGRWSLAGWGNAGPHSGECKIHGKEKLGAILLVR